MTFWALVVFCFFSKLHVDFGFRIQHEHTWESGRPAFCSRRYSRSSLAQVGQVCCLLFEGWPQKKSAWLWRGRRGRWTGPPDVPGAPSTVRILPKLIVKAPPPTLLVPLLCWNQHFSSGQPWYCKKKNGTGPKQIFLYRVQCKNKLLCIFQCCCFSVYWAMLVF